MPNYAAHFADVAPRYDALREEETDGELLDWIAAAARFAAGQAFVDIGCGTGSTTAALARRFSLDAVGVDLSQEMLAAATARGYAECRFVQGRAEQLPFEPDAFDRALIRTAAHLMQRDAAFSQARRVLRDDGRLVIFTVDPASVDEFWLAEWFPSYADIDRDRFPSSETLTDELLGAGFAEAETQRHTRELQFTRDRALTLLRGRFASSFAVMSEGEYQAGVERAEREMPDRFVTSLRFLLVTGQG